MVECELPKLNMRVRFPLPAPINQKAPKGCFLVYLRTVLGKRTLILPQLPEEFPLTEL